MPSSPRRLTNALLAPIRRGRCPRSEASTLGVHRPAVTRTHSDKHSVGEGQNPSPTHRLSMVYASYVRADVGIRPYTPSIAALSVGRGDITPPAVLPTHSLRSSVGADDPVRPNTAQRCHSEPVRRLAWESVPTAFLSPSQRFALPAPSQRGPRKPPQVTTSSINQQEAPVRVLPVPLFALFSALSFSPSRPYRPETAPPSRRTPPRPRQTSWVRCSARRW